MAFDPASADSIRAEAHRWRRQLTSVAQPDEALGTLGKVPVEREVFDEAQAGALSDRLASEVRAHLAN